MAELLLFSGDTAVLRTPLHGQSITVGKSAVNDICIPDDDLPPFLCTLEPGAQGHYRVIDTGGAGVVLDGKKVKNELLKDGASLKLGRLRGTFQATKAVPKAVGDVGQRTGILTRRDDGRLKKTEVRLRLSTGQRLEIPAGGLRIGALPDNDVIIDDGFVSSWHAQLFVRGERLFVVDLDSTNGTFIGDVRVVEAEVPVGSTLRFGKATAKVEGEDSDVELDLDEVVGAEAGVAAGVAAGVGDVVGVKSRGPWKCEALHTADAGFARTFALIEKVAPHDASVCIFGETGTGKELAAHALHTLSGRRQQPFVALNCAAFPEELIESELFGHEKGAFTGADKMRKGAFEEADKGTLFLDEIGELPLEMQAKLLRVLESRAVRRLGGRGDISVDVRIVAATHRDLVQHVKLGRFREDLLHRIYVIPVKLPALRDRPIDIPHLARHLAASLSPRQSVVVTDAAIAVLRTHPFPGNVRELRNVIQRALIMGDGATIDVDDLAFIPATLDEVKVGAALYKKGMTMEDVEKAAIEAAMEAHGSLGEAARALGVAKTTLWRKATAFGLIKEGREP